jgi:hypothetical protein
MGYQLFRRLRTMNRNLPSMRMLRPRVVAIDAGDGGRARKCGLLWST